MNILSVSASFLTLASFPRIPTSLLLVELQLPPRLRLREGTRTEAETGGQPRASSPSPCCASLRNYAPFYSPLFPNCREGREREALETDPSSPHGCQMAKFDPFLSLDCARVESVGVQSKERKGSNFAAQRSGAIVQKPQGPNAYDLKNPAIAIWQSCFLVRSFMRRRRSREEKSVKEDRILHEFQGSLRG